MVNLPGKNDTVHEKGLDAIQIWSIFILFCEGDEHYGEVANVHIGVDVGAGVDVHVYDAPKAPLAFRHSLWV